MGKLISKHLLILLPAFFIFILKVDAQNDCEVLLETISGEYSGGCKKGLADGEGTAKGVDSYIGEFKKGLPHGTGTYTWANGDVYVGEFKKGMKEGKGKLTVNLGDGQKKDQDGYWAKDKYIGLSKNPYEIVTRTTGVLSIRITETDNPANDGNALFFEIQHKARIQQSPRFGLNVTTGSFSARFEVGNKTKVIVSQFPFGFTLEYMGEMIELQLFQETSWNIIIDFNK
jgi:hypothetical protein